MSTSPHFRGYSRLYSDITNGNPDFKESYDIGLECTAATQSDGPEKEEYLALHGPNLMPPHEFVGPEWNAHVNQYMNASRSLARILLRAMAVSLAVPENTFTSLVEPRGTGGREDSAYSILRMNHYPPNLDPEACKIGIDAHCDYGLLTMLLQVRGTHL